MRAKNHHIPVTIRVDEPLIMRRENQISVRNVLELVLQMKCRERNLKG